MNENKEAEQLPTESTCSQVGVERFVIPVDDPDFCPTNCGGIVSWIGGGAYCERCGYKEAM